MKLFRISLKYLLGHSLSNRTSSIHNYKRDSNSIYGENEITLKDKYLKILEELTKSNSEEIKLKATIEL